MTVASLYLDLCAPNEPASKIENYLYCSKDRTSISSMVAAENRTRSAEAGFLNIENTSSLEEDDTVISMTRIVVLNSVKFSELVVRTKTLIEQIHYPQILIDLVLFHSCT